MATLEALKESEATKQRSWYFHWQNLNERKDGITGSGFRHGRCWLHLNSDYHNGRTIGFSWNLWTRFCMLGFDIEDDGLTIKCALPPVAFWLSFGPKFWLLRKWPKRPLSENYPKLMVIDERECGIAIHNGTIWIKPWVPQGSWTKSDPWWKRGVNFSINPFEWVHQKHEVRCADGSWEPFVGSWEIGTSARGRIGGGKNEPDKRETFTYPYRYILQNGTAQDRVATIYVDRREWRPRCFQWTSLFAKVRTTIDIVFDEEVGEKTGSWKGGCTSCGWELLPGEAPEAALRRMERTRTF